MKEPWERGEEDEKDGLGLCSEMECVSEVTGCQ